jgi:hypothetical protein
VSGFLVFVLARNRRSPKRLPDELCGGWRRKRRQSALLGKLKRFRVLGNKRENGSLLIGRPTSPKPIVHLALLRSIPTIGYAQCPNARGSDSRLLEGWQTGVFPSEPVVESRFLLQDCIPLDFRGKWFSLPRAAIWFGGLEGFVQNTGRRPPK